MPLKMPNNNLQFIKVFIFLTGFLSSVPTLLTWHCLNLWLATLGYSPSFLASLGLMGIPYSIKIFFVPILEQYSLSSFKKGQHWQGWLGVSALILGCTLCFLGIYAPSMQKNHLILLGLLTNSCAIAFQSALFFLKIQLLKKEQVASGILAQRVGARSGHSLGEASLLFIAYYLSWHHAYLFCSLIFCIFGIFILTNTRISSLLKKETNFHQPTPLSFKSAFHTIKSYPLILFLAFLINLGDDFISPLVNSYYLECHFDYPTIAIIAKIWGTCCFILGGFIATQLLKKISLLRLLIISTFIHACSLSLFPFLKTITFGKDSFIMFIFFKNTSLGCKAITVAGFFAELIRFSPSKGVLYALLTSMKSLALASSAISGYCHRILGWDQLFILDAMLAVPALMILLMLAYNQEKESLIQSSELT